MLTNLCKSKKVEVPEDDIRKLFERYGPKVHCRLIVLRQGERQDEIWHAVKDDEAKFTEEAQATDPGTGCKSG